MTTYPIQKANRSALLRNTLKGNALFSVLTGLVALVAARPLAAALGIPSVIALAGLGALVLLFGVQVATLGFRPILDQRWVTTVAALDALWVLASALVLATGVGELSPAGWWTVLAVADAVLVFAVLEVVGLMRLRRPPQRDSVS